MFWWIAIALFLVVDVLVVTIAVRGTLKKVGVAGLDFKALAQFAKAEHEEIGAYLRANYSGDQESLPRVLEGLIETLEQRAREHGMTVDRDTLKLLVATSIANHKAAGAREVQKAMATVA